MKKVHRIILIVVSCLAVLSILVLVFWSSIFGSGDKNDSNTYVDNANKTNAAGNQTGPIFYSPLDGLPTTEEKGIQRPIAVMIENHPSARPQSGLSKASIIYETVAEGGITRFMAVFLQNDVESIGPVRSAREYFVDLAKQFDALYAHCGGPSYIYDTIKSYGVADLDEFLNKESYWRVSYRRKPHNLYTSTSKLRKRANTLDYSNDVFYQKPNFKSDAPLSNRASSESLKVNFSQPEYKVSYIYDRKKNYYKRFMGGKPHIDNLTKQQITPKNIVVQYAPISSIVNDPKGRMQVSLIGTGKAVVFRDGRAMECTWVRSSLDTLTRFYDNANNSEIKFNRGLTWIELVDQHTMPVSYQ
ncbi:MAG: DUF3048 domain-containing protein [Rubrobacteridae bacterium]|nr:DUF3048 domain-containing protein [Rubrobacteridae bacterium]